MTSPVMIDSSIRTPNFSPQSIAVQFLVLHYTACNSARAIELLTSPQTQASAHFVLDTDGKIFELVPCLEGETVKAWHAGKSYLDLDGQTYEALNSCSIGVEIVNLNGNLIPYTEAQYESLIPLILKLKELYPALADPSRIVGHEHIAGFRGKVDPGHLFDWKRVITHCYPNATTSTLQPICPLEILREAQDFVAAASEEQKSKQSFWTDLSLWFESKVGGG